jgi:hypothetical protein
VRFFRNFSPFAGSCFDRFGDDQLKIRFFPPGLGAKAQGTPREPQAAAAALRKETGLDGKTWKNHGKTMEKPWKNHL